MNKMLNLREIADFSFVLQIVTMKGFIRKIDELGRIVLPQEFRTELQVGTGCYMCIELKGCTMVLTPTQCVCSLCGAIIENNRKFRLCDACIEEVKNG